MRTTDGGESLSEGVKVDDFYMINIWNSYHQPASHSGPMLAVDSSDGPFKDRLYEVWADNRDGRGAVRLSYSSDEDKTWSRSTVIDDVPGPIDGKSSPDNFQPTVAVNKAGVVLVAWYDRRDNPDGLGWYIRARASLDGGETWLPSVRVSTAPHSLSSSAKLFLWSSAQQPKASSSAARITADPQDSASEDADADKPKKAEGNPTHIAVSLDVRQFFAGDYASLTADASGTFHEYWIDNRTGVPQIWTAPITVDGKAVRNGDPAFADLRDISSRIEVKIMSETYDRGSNTVSLGVQLKNTSKEEIHGPMKMRLINMSSAIGVPSPSNADNQVAQVGAVWDLSSLLKENTLKPDESSEVKQLTFHVSNPRPFFDGKIVRTMDLLNFDVRILAPAQAEDKH